MEVPINQLVPGEEEDEQEQESLFMQLTSQFSLTELLAVMQGNFGAI